MKQVQAPSFPVRDHDHGLCMDGALWRAKSRFVEMGIKWTALRERVFRQIARSHESVSAYDLIESLAKDGKRLAPVSVYRILEVLQAAGLVHRLESRNAFFACMSEHENTRNTITFICDDCGRVTELDAPEAYQAIGEAIAVARFTSRRTMIEVSGVCGECQHAAASC
jgi:Fur family zinc uptake transcriptional regulator